MYNFDFLNQLISVWLFDFSVIRRLEEHNSFFPAFQEVMRKLFDILGKCIIYFHMYIFIYIFDLFFENRFSEQYCIENQILKFELSYFDAFFLVQNTYISGLPLSHYRKWAIFNGLEVLIHG